QLLGALEHLDGEKRLDLLGASGDHMTLPWVTGSAQAHTLWSGRRRRRATPVRCAARTTSRATAGATCLLNTLGMMYSGPSSLRPTHAAIARAAAIFISSLMARARESRRPRKKPG